MRARAIYYLGRFPPESKAALSVLIAALKDKDPYVRKSAAASLAEMGAAAAPATPHLIAAFQDENQEVRRAAATALSYQAKECIPPINHRQGTAW